MRRNMYLLIGLVGIGSMSLWLISFDQLLATGSMDERQIIILPENEMVSSASLPAASQETQPQTPQIENFSGETIPDRWSDDLENRLRIQFELAETDTVVLKHKSGNSYLFSIHADEGGGGFWAVAALDGSGGHTVVTGQDYPDCGGSGLTSIPLVLLPYCFTGSASPVLINRHSGTLVSPE